MTPSITPQVDTPIPAFLSPDELRALTGFTHAARQIAQLQTMGIAHYLNGAGRPVVARARYADYLVRTAEASKARHAISERLQAEWLRQEAERKKAAERARVSATLAKARKLRRAGLVRHHTAKRRAVKMARMPSWADASAIRAIYATARHLTATTGIPHHVDHAIPLQGARVSGLHVETNLQILTGSENSRKRNHYEVE